MLCRRRRLGEGAHATLNGGFDGESVPREKLVIRNGLKEKNFRFFVTWSGGLGEKGIRSRGVAILGEDAFQ